MSNRTILSRPRTRIYDANYNIGENYYRSALDRLDRKYSGRTATPPRQRSLPKELLDRHERTFFDESLGESRRRAEKHITENHLFDSRGGRIARRALDLAADFDDETASSLQRIRAGKKVSVIDDLDLENTVNQLSSRRLLHKSDKLLQSVGLDEGGRRALDEDVSYKRRVLKIAHQEDDVSAGDLTRWVPLAEERESAAALRAKQSRSRISDIEEEMAAMAEKQAARERRAARLKALVAESVEDTEAAQSAIQAAAGCRVRRELKAFEE